ncbi:MAG TPA: hypothetical protein VMT89_04545 [Candidatus Acidoferrales bacterium]|nr:hypothetical protein [Candidatus Acidoferrales bacterium]
MQGRIVFVPLPPGMEAPALRDALSRVVPMLILDEWQQLALPSADTGDYLAHLVLQESLRYPFEGDPDSVAVVNTSQQADWLEDGRGGFHLPSRWGVGGGRWLMGKNGPYARVPFRISTPITASGGSSSGRRRSAMPKSVYALAKRARGKGALTGFGDSYKQSKSYVFFAAAGMTGLPSDAIRSLADDPEGYTWKASQYEGLFSAVQRTPEAPARAEYMTIRTIKPDSPGWYIPPTPAHRFAERALDRAMPRINEILEAAAAQDLTLQLVQAAKGLL